MSFFVFFNHYVFSCPVFLPSHPLNLLLFDNHSLDLASQEFFGRNELPVGSWLCDRALGWLTGKALL